MATNIKRKAAPDMGRLWDLDDLGAYIGVGDPTEASKTPGFPTPIPLNGVRGRRWHGPSVEAFMAAIGSTPATASASSRCAVPDISPAEAARAAGLL